MIALYLASLTPHPWYICMNLNMIFCIFFQGISLGFNLQQASEFLEAARGIAFTAAQAARDRLIQYCIIHQHNNVTIRIDNDGRPPTGGVQASCPGRIENEFEGFTLCNAHGACVGEGTYTIRAHLHPATATRLRYRCDVAPKWVAKQFLSDSKLSRSCSHKHWV